MTTQPVGAPFERHTPVALLVDADADTREMYAFALEQDRWLVEQASTGTEALQSVLATHPDVVVSELQLPELDGYELCRRLKHDPSTERTPIVIVTASAFPADVQRASEAGGDVVLCKPCPPILLVDVLRKMIEEARAMRLRARQTKARAEETIAASRQLIERARQNGVKG